MEVNCVQGQWTFIRALNEYDGDDTLLQEARTYAAALPEQLPQQIGDMTTQQTYRRAKREEF